MIFKSLKKNAIKSLSILSLSLLPVFATTPTTWADLSTPNLMEVVHETNWHRVARWVDPWNPDWPRWPSFRCRNIW